MSRLTTAAYSIAPALALVLLAACAPPSYAIKTPAPSGVKFQIPANETKQQVSLIDERVTKQFSSGVLRADLVVNAAPLDPPQYLSVNLSAELKSRGLEVESVVGDHGSPKVHLKTFNMVNHRASGFSPFYTFTFLGADLESPKGKKRIGVFVQGDKVPVWSFDEVVEPIFNLPMTIVAQEFASKVSNELFNFKAPDTQVSEITGRLASKDSKERYLSTYALGFTNNPLAVGKLVELTKDPDDYVRLAAISSLGTLRAQAQVPLLKSIYENESGLWQERAMAIKAIGDMDTDDSKSYIATELKKLESGSMNGEKSRMSQILTIYFR